MQIRQTFARLHERPEVWSERHSRQLPTQIRCIALAVFRMVQNRVDVVEDVPFGNRPIFVVCAKLLERPVCDVFPAVGTVLIVRVERKPLWNCTRAKEVEIRKSGNNKRGERLLSSNARRSNHSIFSAL